MNQPYATLTLGVSTARGYRSAVADVAISKRPLLFTVWTQLRLRSHQNFYEIFTRKQFLPTSAGNTQAQLQFCGQRASAVALSGWPTEGVWN